MDINTIMPSIQEWLMQPVSYLGMNVAGKAETVVS